MTEKVLVLGAGESGVGAALLAQAKGFDVFVSDFGKIAKEHKNELITAAIPFEEGTHASAPRKVSIVVKSPGIPDTAPIVQELKSNGAKIYSEIEFAFGYTSAKIIAITGTNGKTTTTKLIHHLLTKSGINAGLAGNIGISFAKEVLNKKHDWYVLEISSFQLDDIDHFKPNIALILNITPDHLDRYSNDIQKYADSKFRIIENMDSEGTFIYGKDDTLTNQQVTKRSIIPQLICFTLDFLKENSLEIPFGDKTYTFDNLPLKGPHNAWNMEAAILTALSVGLTPDQIQEALPSFIGEPHRLQEVAIKNDITFVNDSKATNVEAALFALQSFDKPIIWIAGGTDKGNDYSPLISVVKKNVKGLICLGVDNEKLVNTFSDIIPTKETQDTGKAIELALELADKNSIVLLAPACASFDLFKNYMDRGDIFMQEVLKL
ncbi:UDP-N-acetylmuramoyl-L-alanine--D-glutamate ligase [Flammeovirga kamogawensis]|uniref:UDP-N-acetylmuramoylalanine--D-glutamate ligase n=1 Tax=Flammeovirga kamogawensis TaxID=373891 RepID=A0ABX8GUQ0_9BACT|nr:UDP-N-acetylmuramoyl-L-alanine--D-glutamate ligase [Flammeovirga kamogawensis]MBB6459604.1 UDP-N-acetylmuramoylalanine--D-glutamate ligase [Flammeovirga kamogawensis]QWG07333.1 UDP-N-acetylmuramoyl-L-alanine--D-glutamate ligase [Flammeovirga kamogawensis]TRX69150.1 UDP-N-acetylmuramoyl-L-alanine--D-glutamate ligase [Flammeovirga kamogawensis]